jgi:hypothetical protein
LLIENSTKHEKMSVASSHLFMDRIGLAVPKRLQLFGVSKFLYSGRTQNSGAAEFVTFDNLLRESDFVIACCHVLLNFQSTKLWC